eukprot:TRINITY_DN8527_c0_g1_i1.p1 TRINITY_DN8527_c0_g1~~TRINITY_DN8527_c0_g1_i1.p1  ORF type:complete len:423 (-),score=88.67 TRINITY_DN8527_c0_g1_i1:112-1380(-)
MGDSKSWVYMVTARAPTNIAVVKYWGKRDEQLILPINDNISVTLDPDHLSATTTVAVSPSFKSDKMWLNGQEVSLDGDRYQKCLREIRSRGQEVVNQKTGITIKKEDWQRLHLHISSRNNFPTAAGLASSAAGFACLVFALANLMNVDETYEGELSGIARQGSGSACRSLYGGFVKWKMGMDNDGRDSIAVQLQHEKHWEGLTVLVAVVSSKQKETSSTSGMRESVQTSELLQHRAEALVPKRILKMEEAIAKCDFESFARITCADSNQFHAICLDTTPPIFYMNDTSHMIINCIEKWNRYEGKPQVAYTFDAGPNAVMFAPNRKVAGLLLQRLLYYFPPATGSNRQLSSYVVGDTSILQEIGLNTVEDLEGLDVPLEMKCKNVNKIAGGIDYFICTRPGKGPVLLADEQDALLNSETGLPS